MFRNFAKRIQNVKDLKIKTIRSDHGGEFENKQFSDFCNKKGISHNFSFSRTPQQNGVVERKNRTLQECARTLLSSTDLPQNFWAEAVATACYVLNRVSLRPKTKNTPYELFFNKKPKVSYFKIFGAKCFILNTKDSLGKFDPKADEGIFVGYSERSKAYRVLNKRTNIIEETLHVSFDKNYTSTDDDFEINKINQPSIVNENNFETNNELVENLDFNTNQEENILKSPPRILKDHPIQNVLGDVGTRVLTRRQLNEMSHIAFISNLEPKNYKEASKDEYWIIAMQEELNQFERNDV